MKHILMVFFLMSAVSSETALEKTFKALGSNVARTSSGSFHDQSAGYYTGGGVMVRHKNTAVQPINVSLPRLNMGCNGIDMYAGSLSFMKADAMGALAKNMAVGIPTYGLQLALKTMAPQVETLLSQLRKSLLDMNSTMLDSCHMSQQIVGGMWPKDTAASEQICQDVSRTGGADYFGARKHCKADNLADGVDRATARAENKDLLNGEYNVTWKVAKEKLHYDDDLATFAMHVLGTIISKKEGGGYKVVHVKGEADNKDVLQVYLGGGALTTKRCDETGKCLNPSDVRITIAQADALVQKFSASVNRLIASYVNDTPVPEADKRLIYDDIGIPLYSYIQVAAALGTRFLLSDAVSYISLEILLRQIEKVAHEVENALTRLEGVQISSDRIEAFRKNLQTMRGRILHMQSKVNGDAVYQLTHMIKSYEHTIAAKEES